MPFARLGKLAGTSESQARRRVQRMLQAGCMKISAVSDPRSVGFEAQAWVGIRCDVSQSPAEVGRRLAVMSSVTYAVACTGRYEIFAEIVCRDSAELAQIVDSSIRTISGVATIEIFLGLEVFHRPLLAAASPAASPRAV
jgi:Lrp/AsnC family transcriptional regulator for asnA, asnC and gidA